MKTVIVLAAFAFANVAWAQTAKAAAKEPAKPAAAKPVAKDAAKPEPIKEARKASPRRHEDARHCLEKGNNTDIIKCAEAYL